MCAVLRPLPHPRSLPAPRMTLALALLAASLVACAGPDDAPDDPATAAVVAPVGAPQVIGLDAPAAVAGKFLVRLSDRALAQAPRATVGAALAALVADYDGEVLLVVDGAAPGGGIRLDRASAKAMASDPRVAAIEAVVEVRGQAIQEAAPWGLDRIDQRERPLNGLYAYPTATAAVHAYVVDTGFASNHPEFAGRVGDGIDTNPPSGGGGGGPAPNAGCYEHGTHVAGILGGTTYGVAKQVTLHSVRVLNCNVVGDSLYVVAGLQWIRDHHQLPAVVNMSLSIPVSSSNSTMVEALVNQLIAAGITVVASAGNDGADACSVIPARIPGVLTVGAYDQNDHVWAGSNGGNCVDLYAPGVDILSAIEGGSALKTGTSMAAPHVAGAVALEFGVYPSATAAEVATDLLLNRSNGWLLNTTYLYGASPPAPRNLRSYVGTCRWETRFLWDWAPGADYYKVWQSSYADFRTSSLVATTWDRQLTELFSGFRYVAVTACNSHGCGPRSASAPTRYLNGCL